jgi:NadR type nicotinamide-nucleotide adenylyltransferase
MRRVVVTGSECTGKTTLARALAERYDTVWVPEFVREFVEREGRSPVLADVEAIARGQMAREEEIGAHARELLILDTDLLSTILYSRHYYGSCPAAVEAALARRPADLYLLCGIDVPWTPDSDQRDRGDRREEMQTLFRDALVERQFEFVEIGGGLEARLRQAARALDAFVGES